MMDNDIRTRRQAWCKTDKEAGGIHHPAHHFMDAAVMYGGVDFGREEFDTGVGSQTAEITAQQETLRHDDARGRCSRPGNRLEAS